MAFQSWANQGRLSGTQEMCVWDHREPVTAGSTVSLICNRASALRREPGCPESWGCPRSMSRSTPEQVQQGPELRVQSGNDRREDGPTLGRREPPCTLFSVCAPLPAALSQSLVLTPVPAPLPSSEVSLLGLLLSIAVQSEAARTRRGTGSRNSWSLPKCFST